MNKLLAVSVGFLCLTWLYPAFAEGEADHRRMISVSGEAHEEVAPDQASITVSLVSRSKDIATAKTENDKLADKIVVIAKDHKVSKDKISLSNLYIAPEYDYVQSGANNGQVLRGYVVSRTLRITIDEIGNEELLLSAIVAAKVDQVGGIEYKLADPEAQAMRVRVKAFENAKAKAMALTQAAGVKLGAPVSITTGEGMNEVRRPVPMLAMAKAMPVADAASSAPSTPGLVTIQENVQVVFGLE